MIMSFYSGKIRKSTTKKGKGDSFLEYYHKGSASNKQQQQQQKRLLVKINVIGSAGPLKIVVYEKDVVGKVIDDALKLYAKEGRLPLLGCDPSNFLLYCATNKATSHALRPWDDIGSCGARKFVLYRKPDLPKRGKAMLSTSTSMISHKPSWKTWLNKLLILETKLF